MKNKKLMIFSNMYWRFFTWSGHARRFLAWFSREFNYSKALTMARSKIAAIKSWIKEMGFKLVKSHVVNGKATKINYYSLGSFGIYEEISKGIKGGKKMAGEKLRFISWTPWGVDFEVNSVNDLSKAYQDSISYNPDVVLG